MATLKETVSDIKSLKIQGAENVAKEAIKAFIDVVRKSKAKSSRELFSELSSAKKLLSETRPTEPAMRNSIDYILYDVDTSSLVSLSQEVLRRVDNVLKFFERSERAIAEIGANKIKDNMIVFTHCHSSTVVDILLLAKKQGKKFTVYNTETRPLFQGRKTATELAKAGIEVHHFIDSAGRIAIKQADIAFFGADAITTDKIYNKIGTEMFAEAAKRYDTSVYFCANSWKFDPKSIVGFDEVIEERNPKEVWDKPPKGVKVANLAFEKIDPQLASGIICEFGIHPHALFIDEMKERYPWMFR